MVEYTKYDVNGQIIGLGSCPADMVSLQSHYVWIGHADPLTEMFVNGEKQPRPIMKAAPNKTQVLANGTDQVIIAGVPKGARIFMQGPIVRQLVGDGTDLVMTFALAGDYTLKMFSFPYQDKTVVIHAN